MENTGDLELPKCLFYYYVYSLRNIVHGPPERVSLSSSPRHTAHPLSHLNIFSPNSISHSSFLYSIWGNPKQSIGRNEWKIDSYIRTFICVNIHKSFDYLKHKYDLSTLSSWDTFNIIHMLQECQTLKGKAHILFYFMLLLKFPPLETKYSVAGLVERCS